MKKQNIFIDTDCGMDDIIALAMLLGMKINISGITTVRGLTSPFKGRFNLEKIMNYVGKNIPIAAGASRPLKKIRIKNKFPRQDVVNSTNLTFLKNVLKNKRFKRNNFSFENLIEEIILKDDSKKIFVALGPLTNLAKITKKYGKRFTEKIEKVIVMGGAIYSPGNVMPSKKAEYNFYLDPDAANIVMKSGLSIVLVPTDATKFAPVGSKLNKIIKNIKPSSNYAKIIRKTIISNKDDFSFFYDPLAVSILLNPKIVTKTVKVAVNVNSSGICIPKKSGPKIKVVTEIDTNEFSKILFKCLNT